MCPPERQLQIFAFLLPTTNRIGKWCRMLINCCWRVTQSKKIYSLCIASHRKQLEITRSFHQNAKIISINCNIYARLTGQILFILIVSLLTLITEVRAQPINTWNQPQVISLESEFASEPTIIADSSGTVHAFWVSRPRNQEAISAIAYSRFYQNQWSLPVEVVVSPDNRDALFPRAVVDTTGRLHLFWSAPTEGQFGPIYHSWAPAHDAANAQQWHAARLIADGTYQSDVKLDSQGRIHIVYASVLSNEGICHKVTADNGGSWSNPSCILRTYPLRNEEHEVRPRLALDSQDTLHVVWVLDDYSPQSQLAYSGRAVFYARSSDGGLSWEDIITVEEIESRVPQEGRRQPEWGNIIVDLLDRVHIVWVGWPDMQRYHQWSEDGGLTWSRRQVAIPSGGYNNWQGIAVDDNNRLHILWPSLRGMEYSWWEEDTWSPASLLSEIGDPHHAQAAIVLGNQLHTIWQDHGGSQSQDTEFGRIFWATMSIQSPGRTMEPIPMVESGPTSNMNRTQQTVQLPENLTSVSAGIDSSLAPIDPPTKNNPVSSIMIGTLFALLLIAIVVLRQIIKQ